MSDITEWDESIVNGKPIVKESSRPRAVRIGPVYVTADEVRQYFGVPPSEQSKIQKGDKLTVTVEPDKIAVCVNDELVAESPREPLDMGDG